MGGWRPEAHYMTKALLALEDREPKGTKVPLRLLVGSTGLSLNNRES